MKIISKLALAVVTAAGLAFGTSDHVVRDMDPARDTDVDEAFFSLRRHVQDRDSFGRRGQGETDARGLV